MDQRYKDIQASYIAAMNATMPTVLSWWDRHANDKDPVDAEAFKARWPAGPVAHPYVLRVFREYFLQVDDLNLQMETERTPDDRPPAEEDWGEDINDPIEFVRPSDLLINDIEFIDPKLFEVLQNLVFVPVGANAGEEFV